MVLAKSRSCSFFSDTLNPSGTSASADILRKMQLHVSHNFGLYGHASGGSVLNTVCRPRHCCLATFPFSYGKLCAGWLSHGVISASTFHRRKPGLSHQHQL
jgi:hypothetical protein